MTGRKHSKETLLKLSEGVRNRDSSVWVRGEDKPNAKFKDEDIIEIKKLISKGFRTIDIAELYNVEGNTITQIKTGERWNHIKTEYDDLIIQTPRQKLTKDNIIEIKKLLTEEKLTIIEIAELFEITFGMISSIKTFKSYEDIGIEYNDKLKKKSIVKKLNKNMVTEIKHLLMEDKSCKEISEIYSVHPATISYINQNKIWKDVEVKGFPEWVVKRNLLKKIPKNGSRVPIIQLSIDGEFIKEWACSSEVADALNIDSSSITKCCKGKQKTSKGFKWIYKDDLEEVS
jgi:transcriptional regulator with XRE-family HTH domain